MTGGQRMSNQSSALNNILNPSDADSLLRRLRIHRRNLLHAFEQRSALGILTPQHIAGAITDEADAIEVIKELLRSGGVAVEDLPGDTSPRRAETPATPNPPATTENAWTQLLDALLACDCIAVDTERDHVIAALRRSDPTFNVRRSGNVRIHVDNLIAACLKKPQRLWVLAGIVRTYEGDIDDVARVEQAVALLTSGTVEQ